MNSISYTTLTRLEEKYGVALPLLKGEVDSISVQPIRQVEDYLERIVNSISGNDPHIFLESFLKDDISLTASLFITNPALWKIMQKKSDSPDTMLPVISIPWFRWEEAAENPSNPYGIIQDDMTPSTIQIEKNGWLRIDSIGGNFCGIVEGRVADSKRGGRPLFSPTLPGSKKLVPMYEKSDIVILLKISELSGTIFPAPRKEYDYTFSENPRIFYEYGMELSTKDSGCILKIGKRKATKSAGEVSLILTMIDNEMDSFSKLDSLLAMVALRMLSGQNISHI